MNKSLVLKILSRPSRSSIPKAKSLTMLLLLVAFMSFSLAGPIASVAATSSANPTANFTLVFSGGYACTPKNCETAVLFRVFGYAHGTGGKWKLSAVGEVEGVNSQGCLVQQETWSFSDKAGAVFISTVGDTYCPTSNPNIYAETAAFVIIGGTGAFSGASGYGNFALAVEVSPQVGTGVITCSITY